MFSYTNRKGAAYYLHAGKTKTGKTRYTMKRSCDDALAELPDGYEVVENVNAKVSVRVARPRRISPLEEKLVQAALERFGLSQYRVEVKGEHITVFEPDIDSDALAELIGNPFEADFAGLGSMIEAKLREVVGDDEADRYIRHRKDETRRLIEQRQRYSPVFRFALTDRKARTFAAERMSFLGEGGWHFLAALPLPKAVEKYLPHLDKDSFFELI